MKDAKNYSITIVVNYRTANSKSLNFKGTRQEAEDHARAYCAEHHINPQSIILKEK